MNPLPPESDPPHSTPLTAGQRLRTAREAKGLDLAAFAVKLKVSARLLHALESDDYAAFHGVAFLRATALAMCRHLNLDPTPVLCALPPAASSMPVSGLSSRPVHRQAMPLGRSLQRSGWMALGVLMLIAAAIFLWWPISWLGADADTTPSQQMSEDRSGEVSAGSEPVPAAEGMSTVAAPAVPASEPAAERKTALQIVATGETHLEIRDARGQLLVNRLLRAGDSEALELSAALTVVLGRAQSARVTLAGQPYDLTPVTKGTVARFEIQP